MLLCCVSLGGSQQLSGLLGDSRGGQCERNQKSQESIGDFAKTKVWEVGLVPLVGLENRCLGG